MPKQTTKSKKNTPRKPAARSKTSSKSKKGLTHHAKHLYHVTPKFVHGMVVGAFVGIVALLPVLGGNHAGALSINSGKDCDQWSIINCGVQSTGEIKKAHDGDGYVKNVFKYFTISSKDIDNIGKTAVKGTVYDNGKVEVNGKVVAKDAITAARLRVTDKDRKVTYNGKTFYTRYLRTSWSHKSAPAYVVMNDGVFNYAILAPCGNPIVGTPTTKKTTPTPTGKPTPQQPVAPIVPDDTPPPALPTPTTPTLPDTPPELAPPPRVDTNITPPANQKTLVQTSSSVTTLPKTGISSIVFVFAMAAIGGYIFHMSHHHIKKHRSHRRHAH